MQQNIMPRTEDLELSMKLESYPVGDAGVEIMQIQSQLVNLMLQIQHIKKGKYVQEEMWCTKCRTEGHHKDNFPRYINYVASRAQILINTKWIPWFRIF